MTEFEIATLALQESDLALQKTSLAYQEASLALRESALWVAVAQVIATVVIGAGQIAVVWFGIRAMQRAGTQRALEQDQRHAESMRALDALIDGQRQANEALARQGEALTRQGAALEALLARPAS